VIRPGTPQDARFLRDMLRHAYYWRPPEEAEGGVHPMNYVENWGRPGDAAMIAVDQGFPVGAAWYRLFKDDEPGYGFVDEETPELAIAIVPSRRGRGLGKELLATLVRIAAERGYGRVEWVVLDWNEPAQEFYRSLGARPMDEWTVWRIDGDALEQLGGGEA
jgi:ribosomal protein S18 acetylase RimI-like enzyme